MIENPFILEPYKSKELFCDGDLSRPLNLTEPYREAAEALRWAPSAVNKQPWRVICQDGRFHFYEKKDKGYVSDAVGDMQKIDLGIGLCHFMLALEASDRRPVMTIEDPQLPVLPEMEYIATVEA